MRNLQIIGNVPQVRRESNFGEYAEEAVIIEEPVKPKRVNHFIEANSVEVTLDHLKNENVIPVFSKDNELTISHPQFIETVWEAANSFYSGEQIEQPDIRCSHVVKGRRPESINKPKNLLTEADTTQYYERCAFWGMSACSDDYNKYDDCPACNYYPVAVGNSTGTPVHAIGVEMDPHFFSQNITRNDGSKAEDWENIVVQRVKKMKVQQIGRAHV